MNKNAADLFGQTIGTWEVLEYLGSTVTAYRGGSAGLRTGAAKRSLWRVRCIVCSTEKEFTTYYLHKKLNCTVCYKAAYAAAKL